MATKLSRILDLIQNPSEILPWAGSTQTLLLQHVCSIRFPSPSRNWLWHFGVGVMSGWIWMNRYSGTKKVLNPIPIFCVCVSVCASLTKLSDLRNDLSCCIMQLNLSSSSDRWPDVLLQDFLSDAGINVSLNCGKHPDLEAAKLSHSITLPPPCMTESIMAVLLYSLFSLSALMIPCLPVT